VSRSPAPSRSSSGRKPRRRWRRSSRRSPLSHQGRTGSPVPPACSNDTEVTRRLERAKRDAAPGTDVPPRPDREIHAVVAFATWYGRTMRTTWSSRGSWNRRRRTRRWRRGAPGHGRDFRPPPRPLTRDTGTRWRSRPFSCQPPWTARTTAVSTQRSSSSDANGWHRAPSATAPRSEADVPRQLTLETSWAVPTMLRHW
jgi:hypothetical protein